MQTRDGLGLLNLGARQAFIAMCDAPARAARRGLRSNTEIRDMLSASFARLNAEFGFCLAIGSRPTSTASRGAAADRAQLRPLPRPDAGAAHGAAGFMEQFRRMLVSKLRVVFETAGGEIELWNQSAWAQIDASCASAAGVQAAPRVARADPARGRRARDAHRRARGPGRAAAASRRASRSCRGAARARLRGAARRPTTSSSEIDLPLVDDAVPSKRRQRARPDARLRHASPAERSRATFPAPRSPSASSPGSAARPPRAAVAEHARPVPRLAVRDHAAADAGRDRARLLRALPRALPRRRARSPPRARRRARRLERPRLLQPRAQPASLRAGRRRRARRPVPGDAAPR